MNASSSLFRVRNVFELEGGRSVIANLYFDAPEEEVFEALLAGYRDWSTAGETAFTQLQVFMNAPVRKPEHETLLRYLVKRWNAADRPRCPGRVDVWLGSTAQCWYGFTNGIFPDDPSKRKQRVRYITYEEMESALTAYAQDLKDCKRAERLANPVRNPCKLPRSIASEMARYLRLEYAELEVDRIKAKALAFVGEVEIDCVPTQFWSVSAPSFDGPLWAVVERFEDGYVLSSASELPGKLRGQGEV